MFHWRYNKNTHSKHIAYWSRQFKVPAKDGNPMDPNPIHIDSDWPECKSRNAAGIETYQETTHTAN